MQRLTTAINHARRGIECIAMLALLSTPALAEPPKTVTGLPGESLELDLGTSADLPASASQIAALIRATPVADAGCTEPTRLLAEGYALVVAQSDFDGYRLPSEYCGTGGCIYVEFRVDADGCYRGDPEQGVLAASPPWPTQSNPDRTR
jgi:hypothetical protein